MLWNCCVLGSLSNLCCVESILCGCEKREWMRTAQGNVLWSRSRSYDPTEILVSSTSWSESHKWQDRSPRLASDIMRPSISCNNLPVVAGFLPPYLLQAHLQNDAMLPTCTLQQLKAYALLSLDTRLWYCQYTSKAVPFHAEHTKLALVRWFIIVAFSEWLVENNEQEFGWKVTHKSHT